MLIQTRRGERKEVPSDIADKGRRSDLVVSCSLLASSACPLRGRGRRCSGRMFQQQAPHSVGDPGSTWSGDNWCGVLVGARTPLVGAQLFVHTDT
eukprot:10169916-Alexandrium_andersonii.AAC.1